MRWLETTRLVTAITTSLLVAGEDANSRSYEFLNFKSLVEQAANAVVRPFSATFCTIHDSVVVSKNCTRQLYVRYQYERVWSTNEFSSNKGIYCNHEACAAASRQTPFIASVSTRRVQMCLPECRMSDFGQDVTACVAHDEPRRCSAAFSDKYVFANFAARASIWVCVGWKRLVSSRRSQRRYS